MKPAASLTHLYSRSRRVTRKHPGTTMYSLLTGQAWALCRAGQHFFPSARLSREHSSPLWNRRGKEVLRR